MTVVAHFRHGRTITGHLDAWTERSVTIDGRKYVGAVFVEPVR